jgi:hypothetical protein
MKPDKGKGPGPGAYINPDDPFNSSVKKSLRAFKNEGIAEVLNGRKVAPFGSD